MSKNTHLFDYFNSALSTLALSVGPVFAADRNAVNALDTTASVAADPWQRYSDWPDTDYSKFNTLRTSVSPPPSKAARSIKLPATADPAVGAELAFDRKRGGSCVACHVMGPDTPELPGNVGPDLSNIGAAARPDDYLFNYIYDPRVYNPAAVMPPWGAHGVFNDEEIFHMVAFLKTLKTANGFLTELDNPGQRPQPVEDRDNLDPTENPAMQAVEDGEILFKRKGPTGKSCADCHANPEKDFKHWAASMPRYEPGMKKILGVEEFVGRHGRATTGEGFNMQSPENSALAIYLRYLANGSPISVDVSSAEAKAAITRAEQLMQTKIGQLNFSCTDCHSPDKGANKWIRGQWLGESRGQLDHFPTWRTSRSEIWDIRKRFQWCNVAIRANELPPDAPEYDDLELYLANVNKGLPLSVPGIRH